MHAIVTVTFHPCIDVNVSVPALAPEIKLSCSTPMFHPGGGGINVARAIKKLGGEATAIFMAGGYNGERLTAMLGDEEVPSVVLGGSGNTRENLIVTDASTGLQYRFNLPGPGVTSAALIHLLALLKRAEGVRYLVVSGSLAPGMSVGIFDELAAIATKKNIKMIVDTSGEALKAAAQRGVYLIKVSVHELLSLSGKGENKQSVEAMARQLVARGTCGAVVVSMGAGGALLATKEGVNHFPSPAVKVCSTVGAGDSMLAGIVLRLEQGRRLEDAVAYGCLCGAAATLHPGTSLCSLADVASLKSVEVCS